jgi:hypothetical protein
MRNRALLILLTTLAVMALYGCTSDETASRFLAAPDKYMLYSCEELARAAESNEGRQRELEPLMKKAGVDAGGRFISNQAYQPEYTMLRGDMKNLRKAAAEKNCNLSEGVSGVGGR